MLWFGLCLLHCCFLWDRPPGGTSSLGLQKGASHAGWLSSVCDCCCGHWRHLPLTQLTCSISVTVFSQAASSSPDKGSVTGTVSAHMTDTGLLRCGLRASLGLCERSVETCPERTRPSECSSCLSFLSDLPSFPRRAAFRIS